MTLIARLSRLFQADMHALLDQIEEPGQLLKQAIRDMETAIAADERQIRCWEDDRQLLSNKLGHLTESLADLEGKLSLCFQSDKDDLARLLVKQKLEIQQATQVLTEKIAIIKDRAQRLIQHLAERKSQLAAMKQKADAFLDESNPCPAHWEHFTGSVRDEDVEVAFMYEKQKWGES